RVIPLLILLYREDSRTNILIVHRSRTFHISIIAFPKRIQIGCRMHLARLRQDTFSCTKESASFCRYLGQFGLDICFIRYFTLPDHCPELNGVSEPGPQGLIAFEHDVVVSCFSSGWSTFKLLYAFS